MQAEQRRRDLERGRTPIEKPPLRRRTRWADAEGTRLAFDTTGKGPPIIFLHAGIADRRMWDPQVTALAERHQCVAFDLRGFGESAIGAAGFSRREDVAAVADAAGIGTADLVGCSIGGGIALDFAIERPERVRRLVLVGVTPLGFDAPDPALDELMSAAEEAHRAGDREAAADIEVRAWVDGTRRPAGTAPGWLRDKARDWILSTYGVTGWELSRQLDPPAMQRLDEVVAPTLVVVGSDDADGVQAGCEATAAGIANATLIHIEGTAHLPNLEQPDRFTRELSRFLG